MKRSIVLSLVISMAVLLFLTGCPFVSSLERDTQVVINDGNTVKAYTVNQFNNAVVNVPEAPEGKVFYGWTPLKNWEGMDLESIPTTASKGLVRYDEVKSYIVGESRSVEIYPVFIDAPKKDLVIGWYAKSGTSGIDQAAMDAFETKLVAFLGANGYDMKTFDYAIKGYEGGVADSLALVKADKNVDILVGWAASSNLTGTGGWVEGEDFLENVGNITIGTKARYTARLNERDITYKVYAWIQNEFGAGEVAAAPAAAPAPAPVVEEPKAEAPAVEEPAALPSSDTLVIGWYAKTATSGLDEAIMAKVEKGIKSFLAANGMKTEVIVKAYDGVVADVEAAVVADANVDLMIGMKAWSPAGYEMETIQDLAMGEKTGRRINLLGKSAEAKAVFDWFTTEAAQAKLLPGEDTAETLVIGWYAKTATSGLDEAIMGNVENAVKAYLASIGMDAEITVKAYDGVVADVEAAVVADANVDLMVGMKAWAPAGYEMETIQDLTMGEKTGRRINLLGKGEAAKAVFAWFGTEEAQKCLLTPVSESLVIGWYAKTGTSGLDEEIMAKVESAVKAYLASASINAEVTVKAYDGVVAEVEAAVVADANVDIMVGMKAWSPAGYEMEVLQDLAMGDKTGRRIHLLGKGEAAKAVFAWFGTEEAQANLLK